MIEFRFHPLRLLTALLRPLDPALMLILGALLGYAFVLIASASPERMDSQIVHVGVALAAMWLVASVPIQRLLSLALPLYVLGVLLLVAVELFGEVSKGAQRWLDVGVTRIQPSELMKIAMPLMLAWWFQRREGTLKAADIPEGAVAFDGVRQELEDKLLTQKKDQTWEDALAAWREEADIQEYMNRMAD